jgi:hypothetical protein
MGETPTRPAGPSMRKLLVAGALAASVGLSGLALSATAEESDGTSDAARQQAGSDRADLRLNAVVAELDGLRDEPGFGSFVLDEDRLRVTVGWKGVVPPELAGKVGKRADGVTVAVRPVAYEESELRSATEALGQEASRSGWPWSSVRPNDGSTGLVVELDQDKVTEGSPEALEFEQRIRASTSVPVTFEYVDGGYIER